MSISLSLWVWRLRSNWAPQSVVSLPSRQLQRASDRCLFFPLTSPFLLSDKAGRSVPAPGRGALKVAREIQSEDPLPSLDVAYRSRQMTFRRNQISEWLLIISHCRPWDRGKSPRKVWNVRRSRSSYCSPSTGSCCLGSYSWWYWCPFHIWYKHCSKCTWC